MNNSVKYYLVAYNFIAFAFWLAYLVSFIAAGAGITATGLLLLNIAQGMAFLEIVHAILKWVKSPVVSTAAQVSSRLLVLVVLNVLLRHNDMTLLSHMGLLIISFAWSITEVIRYSYYGLGLFKTYPSALQWLRYSLFIFLYPAGVTGEWLILAAPIVKNHYSLDLYFGAMALIAFAYIYFFPVLYMYMWRQRRAKLPQLP